MLGTTMQHCINLPKKGEEKVNNLSAWIAHLHHPLVFAGFGLFLFALIIKPLFGSITNVSEAGTEQLLWFAMLFLFLLAAMAVVVRGVAKQVTTLASRTLRRGRLSRRLRA